MSFLEKVSEFGSKWCKRRIVRRMITRYYRFMLLKASFPNNILLVPTLDIEIIWQTHLLRPEKYRSDCLRLFHRIIDHSLFLDEIGYSLKNQAFVDTCQLYHERFGEPYCFLPATKNKRELLIGHTYDQISRLNNDDSLNYSYWDKTYFNLAQKASSIHENPFSFTEMDVISDSNWLKLCKSFMKRSSLHIRKSHLRLSNDISNFTSSNLMLLKKSYERFLYIAAKYPPQKRNELLCATYAVRSEIAVFRAFLHILFLFRST